MSDAFYLQTFCPPSACYSLDVLLAGEQKHTGKCTNHVLTCTEESGTKDKEAQHAIL